jgi:hypothetical protein
MNLDRRATFKAAGVVAAVFLSAKTEGGHSAAVSIRKI